MIDYRLAQKQDMEGVIDFINMVFSMLRIPHNFEALLPKVYAGEESLADIHLIAEEEGRLCGCLAMYEFPLRVGGETLRVGYMGSMAVHPRVRGKGTMGELMRRQTLRGREMGMDMLVLGGQRQRYERHGYTPAGVTYTYAVSAANVRHALADVDAQGVTFRPFAQEDVAAAFALYNAQPVAGARTPKNFLATLGSYQNKAWVIAKDGEFAGYFVASADGQQITELRLADMGDALPVVKAWLQEMNVRSVRVEAAPYDPQLNRTLAPICEGYSMGQNCMLQVVNVERVVKAYMQLKNQMEPLADGVFTIGWGKAGTYKIGVENGAVSVEKTDDMPDAQMSELEAMHLLFGWNRFSAPQVDTPRGWFPLPFHIPGPDSF